MEKTTKELMKRHYDQSMDAYLTDVCIGDTMGQVVYNREHAGNTKAFVVNSLIFNAVFELDVDLIKTIITRIDGLVPDENKREGFANILGDALDTVLEYEQAEQCRVTQDDTAIIAIAKVLIAKASMPVGSNYMARKERNLAAQMVLERTGGRKIGPTKPMLETKYVEPEWMRISGGSNEGQRGVGNSKADS